MATITADQLRGSGEGQTLAFKRSLSLMKEAFETITGMANSDAASGAVVFGVDPTGGIVGLGDANLDSAQQKFARHAMQKIEPAVRLQFHPFECEGKPVLVMSIKRDRVVPYHEYDGRAFVRVGSVTRQLQLNEKQRLTAVRNRESHSGPWKCDKCGAIAGQVSVTIFDGTSMRKIYAHECGGEWWPAI